MNRISSFCIFAGLGLAWVAACGSTASDLFQNVGSAGSSGSAGIAMSTGAGAGGSSTNGGSGGAAGSSETMGTAGGTAGVATTGGAGTNEGSGGTSGSGGAPGTGGSAGNGTGGIGGSGAGGAGGAKGGSGGTASGGSGGTAGTGSGGRDAGAAGAGGGTVDAGSDVCARLETAYREALVQAKTCDPQGISQCLSLANNSLSCPGCMTHVQDASELRALQTKWTAAGCRRGICPAIACVNPLFGQCSKSGGPGGRCIDTQQISR